MKSLLALICLSLFFQLAIGQTYISTVEPIYWGSLSANEANYGFYGVEFEVEEDSRLIDISAFIVDLKDRYNYDTLPTISFEVWTFEDRPVEQIFTSPELQVIQQDLDRWKRYDLAKPLDLSKGRYLVAVGQTHIQGFVAFGQSKRIKGYKSQVWIKGPFPGHYDGTEWFTGWELYEKIGEEIAYGKVDEEQFKENIVMLGIYLEKQK